MIKDKKILKYYRYGKKFYFTKYMIIFCGEIDELYLKEFYPYRYMQDIILQTQTRFTYDKNGEIYTIKYTPAKNIDTLISEFKDKVVGIYDYSNDIKHQIRDNRIIEEEIIDNNSRKKRKNLSKIYPKCASYYKISKIMKKEYIEKWENEEKIKKIANNKIKEEVSENMNKTVDLLNESYINTNTNYEVLNEEYSKKYDIFESKLLGGKISIHHKLINLDDRILTSKLHDRLDMIKQIKNGIEVNEDFIKETLYVVGFLCVRDVHLTKSQLIVINGILKNINDIYKSTKTNNIMQKKLEF